MIVKLEILTDIVKCTLLNTRVYIEGVGVFAGADHVKFYFTDQNYKLRLIKVSDRYNCYFAVYKEVYL